MPEDQTQLDEILIGIEDLKKKKGKDSWDKLATIGQLLSGVVLVAVGIIVTWSINRAQQESARKITETQISSATSINEAQRAAAQKTVQAQIENSTAIQRAQAQTSTDIQNAQSATAKEIQNAQAATSRDIANAQARTSKEIASANLDATNRSIASGYVEEWTSKTESARRRELLNTLDAAVDPAQAVPLAIHLTGLEQMRADICNGQLYGDRFDPGIARAARALLERLRLRGAKQLLQRISEEHIEPDSNIARALLDDVTRVYFRVSEIDDIVDVSVSSAGADGVTTVPAGRFTYGNEYDWVEVTSMIKLKRVNAIDVLVTNDVYEGSGIKLEVLVGAQLYSRRIRRHDWSSVGGAFRISLGLLPDPSGKPFLNSDRIEILNPSQGLSKPCPADVVTPQQMIAAW